MAMKFPITMCQLSLRVFWVDAGEDVAGAYGLVLVSHKDTKSRRLMRVDDSLCLYSLIIKNLTARTRFFHISGG